MVTTRYSDQQGSKSRQNPCQVQPPENIGNLSASRRCLNWVRTIIQFLTCLDCCQHFRICITSYREEDCLMMCSLSTKDIKSSLLSYRRLAQRQVMQYFRRVGTDQCQNGSSNLLSPSMLSMSHMLYPRHTNSGCGRRAAHKNWSMVEPENSSTRYSNFLEDY